MSTQWEPEFGQAYWCVQYTGQPVCFQWMNTDFQQMQFRIGNVFRTRSEAEQACDLFKCILLDLQEANDTLAVEKYMIERPDKLPNWCKVGEWVYMPAIGEYMQIKKVDDDLLFDKEGCHISYEDCGQARLRPYSADEMRGLVGKVLEWKSNRELVISYNEAEVEVYVDRMWCNAEYLMTNEYTIDGSPCGVLEHLQDGEWVR